jgi:hypothetical protein
MGTKCENSNPSRRARRGLLRLILPFLLCGFTNASAAPSDDWTIKPDHENWQPPAHERITTNKPDHDNWRLPGQEQNWTFLGEKENWAKERKAEDQLEQLRKELPAKAGKLADLKLKTPLDKLSTGMPAEEVQKLIGKPVAKDSEFWIFPDGYVEFSSHNLVSRIRKGEYPPSTKRVVVSVTGLNPSSPAQAYGYTNSRDVYVHGYTRKDGTEVAAYHRTAPNGTLDDNYSTRGNINPYTGQPGTKPRDEDTYSDAAYRQVTATIDQLSRADRMELIRQCDQQLVRFYTSPSPQSTEQLAAVMQLRSLLVASLSHD